MTCPSGHSTFPPLAEHLSSLTGTGPVAAGAAGVLPGPKREPSGGVEIPGRQPRAPGVHLTGEWGARRGTLGSLPVPNWEMLGLSSLPSRYCYSLGCCGDPNWSHL